MSKIRIGNDVKIRWTILNKDGSIFDFDSVRGLRIEIYPTVNECLRYSPEVFVEGNSLFFVFPMDKQTRMGPYDVRLEFLVPDSRFESGYSREAMDKSEAFTLVPHSFQSTLLLGDDDVIDLTSVRQVRKTYGEVYWGDIKGDITNQRDLMGLVILLESEEAYEALGNKEDHVIYCW